jgi:hypothetical protein
LSSLEIAAATFYATAGKFAPLRGATPSQASRLNRRTEIHLERRGLEKRLSRSRIIELAAVEVWGVSSCSNIMTPAYTSAIICASVIGVSIATVQATVQRLMVQFLRSPASDHFYFSEWFHPFDYYQI